MPHINPKGIDKSRKRLSEATQCLNHCKISSAHEEFAAYWGDFLSKCAAIIHILETSSRASPQGRQWHGAKSKQSRKDPLVRYLYQARNAEEHGIEPVTKLDPGCITIGAPGEIVHIEYLEVSPKGIKGTIRQNSDGTFPTVTKMPPQLHLLTVVDERYGTVFEPPTEHLGQPIPDNNPIAVGELYVAYLNDLIDEAERIAKSS